MSLLALLLLSFVWGCAHERNLSPPVELPPELSEPAPLEKDAAPWWKDLEDPELNALIQKTLEKNLTLQQSWARITQFQAVAVQQGAADWPSVSASLDASRRHSNFVNPITASLIGITNNNFSASISASYEVDIWGRLEAIEEAARLNLEASREDLEATAMTLAAQVAETWYSLVEQRARLQLLRTQEANNQKLLQLVELRFANGQSNSLAVYQQRQQARATQAQIPLVNARIEALERQLEALCGVAPGQKTIPKREDLPPLAQLPENGVPSNLLQRRPDLKAAHLRVRAADQNVAVAVANRFPSLRLTASTGYQAQDLKDILDGWIWNLAGNLTIPLFEGGRRKAEVKRQEAILRESLARYGQTILQAIQEVQDALGNEAHQRLYIQEVDAQLALSRATLDQAQRQYVQGTSDFLAVLNALNSVQQAEQNKISAHRQLLSYRIQLHRALGGTWTHNLQDPSPQQKDENGGQP